MPEIWQKSQKHVTIARVVSLFVPRVFQMKLWVYYGIFIYVPGMLSISISLIFLGAWDLE